MVTTHLVSTIAVAAGNSLVAAWWPRVAARLAVPATEPPRRACPWCGRPMRPGWRGWLRFGRACGACPAAPPSPWVLSGLVAVAAGALTWRASPLTAGRDALVLAWLIIVQAGALLATIDLLVQRLPTVLITVMGAGVGTCIVAAAVLSRQPYWAARAAIAAAVLGGAYLMLALLTPSGMGMGDVRLAAVLGAVLGVGGLDAVLLGAVLPYLLAAPYSVARLSRRRHTDAQVPFGPFLVAGAILAAIVVAF